MKFRATRLKVISGERSGKIRSQGFVLRPANDDLYIEPINALSESQCRWLTDNKRQLLAELNAERWDQFLVLAREQNVTADEVSARFTSADIIDLIAEPDDRLPLHAKTVAEHIKRSRTHQESFTCQFITSDVPNLVKEIQTNKVSQTCGSSKHFRRYEWHGNLGSCNIRAEAEAASGN